MLIMWHFALLSYFWENYNAVVSSEMFITVYFGTGDNVATFPSNIQNNKNLF